VYTNIQDVCQEASIFSIYRRIKDEIARALKIKKVAIPTRSKPMQPIINLIINASLFVGSINNVDATSITPREKNKSPRAFRIGGHVYQEV